MAPLLAANLGLLAAFDLTRHLVLALVMAGLGFAALPFAVRRLEAEGARSGPSGLGTAGAAVLAGAVLLRLPLLALPPTLSDDVLRYLWDGKVLAAGYNPYALAPGAPELAHLRAEVRRLPPHPEVATIYPPLAMAAFSIAAQLPLPILSWKLLATAADLGACALLIRLARRSGLPEGRAAWYAWNPLVTLEVAGMGHVDALGVAAVLAAVSLLPAAAEGVAGGATARSAARRAAAAGAWAAAGVLVKLAPLAAFPLWARRSGRTAVFLGAGLALASAGVLPVVAATGGIPPGLTRYAVSWEFNGPLHEPLWRLLDRAGAAPALARVVEALEHRTGEYQAWDWIYPLLYPQLLAKAALALLAAAAVVASLAERRPVGGTGRLFGRLVLASATLYPWYLLWVLPWAALARHRAWLALSGLVLLSYLPQARGIPLMPWVYLAIWVPFFVLLVAEARAHRWSTA